MLVKTMGPLLSYPALRVGEMEVPEGRAGGSDTAQGQSDKIQKPQKHTTSDLLSIKVEAVKLGRWPR